MPTCEYECSHCGYHFEIFQKITDFYATDYRKKKTKSQSDSKAEPSVCPKAKKGCPGCNQE